MNDPRHECGPALMRAFETVLMDKIGGRITSFDAVAAQHSAELMALRRSAGRPVDLRDTMIAGMAGGLGRLLRKLIRVAYFPDLAPYAYGRGVHPGVVHVGWLDGVHPFPKGVVDRHLIEKMKLLAAKPVELYRGSHVCEMCAVPADVVKTFVPDRGKLIDPKCSWMHWTEQRRSNGEIRVTDEGITFAAPVLIVHYIEEHDYLPPVQFLKAVEKLQ